MAGQSVGEANTGYLHSSFSSIYFFFAKCYQKLNFKKTGL